MKISLQIPDLINVHLLIWPLLILYPFSTIATTTAGIVSIEYTPGYLAQRECVQSALWSGRNAAGEWNILDWLGCTNHLDSCFCRADLASSASSLLTSGINSFCSSDATDVASGIAVYNSYCSRTGPATVDTTSTTTGSDSSTATVTATQTVFTSTAPGTTPLESQTSSDTSNSKSGFTLAPSSPAPNSTSTSISATSSSTASGGLSLSDRIALGVGLGVGLPMLPIGLIGIYLSFWMVLLMKPKKKQKSTVEPEAEQQVVHNET